MKAGASAVLCLVAALSLAGAVRTRAASGALDPSGPGDSGVPARAPAALPEEGGVIEFPPGLYGFSSDWSLPPHAVVEVRPGARFPHGTRLSADTDGSMLRDGQADLADLHQLGQAGGFARYSSVLRADEAGRASYESGGYYLNLFQQARSLPGCGGYCASKDAVGFYAHLHAIGGNPHASMTAFHGVTDFHAGNDGSGSAAELDMIDDSGQPETRYGTTRSKLGLSINAGGGTTATAGIVLDDAGGGGFFDGVMVYDTAAHRFPFAVYDKQGQRYDFSVGPKGDLVAASSSSEGTYRYPADGQRYSPNWDHVTLDSQAGNDGFGIGRLVDLTLAGAAPVHGHAIGLFGEVIDRQAVADPLLIAVEGQVQNNNRAHVGSAQGFVAHVPLTNTGRIDAVYDFVSSPFANQQGGSVGSVTEFECPDWRRVDHAGWPTAPIRCLSNDDPTKQITSAGPVVLSGPLLTTGRSDFNAPAGLHVNAGSLTLHNDAPLGINTDTPSGMIDVEAGAGGRAGWMKFFGGDTGQSLPPYEAAFGLMLGSNQDRSGMDEDLVWGAAAGGPLEIWSFDGRAMLRQAVLDPAGRLSLRGRLNAALHTPSSSHESCRPGDSFDDATYHYVCIAPDRLRRVALQDF